MARFQVRLGEKAGWRDSTPTPELTALLDSLSGHDIVVSLNDTQWREKPVPPALRNDIRNAIVNNFATADQVGGVLMVLRDHDLV